MRKGYELIQPVTTHNGRMVFFQLPYTKGNLFNQAICFYYNGLFQNGKRYLKSCNWFNVEICSSYKNEPKPFFQLREVEKKKKKKTILQCILMMDWDKLHTETESKSITSSILCFFVLPNAPLSWLFNQYDWTHMNTY